MNQRIWAAIQPINRGKSMGYMFYTFQARICISPNFNHENWIEEGIHSSNANEVDDLYDSSCVIMSPPIFQQYRNHIHLSLSEFHERLLNWQINCLETWEENILTHHLLIMQPIRTFGRP